MWLVGNELRIAIYLVQILSLVQTSRLTSNINKPVTDCYIFVSCSIIYYEAAPLTDKRVHRAACSMVFGSAFGKLNVIIHF